MRIIIFIFACVTFLSGQILSERVAEVITEAKYNKICMDECKIPKSRIEQLSANDVPAGSRTKLDEKYMYCVLEKNNMVTKHGKLYYANLMNGVKPSIKTAFQKHYRTCLNVYENSIPKMTDKEAVVFLVMCTAELMKKNNKDIRIITTNGI